MYFIVREKLKEHADGIYQYISNMKEGVKRGMVRSVEDCKAGIHAVRQEYLNISLHNETGKPTCTELYYT